MYQFREQKDHLRLEFNLKNELATLEPPVINPIVSNILGTSIIGIKSYAFDDLVARKLNALKDRCEGKDVWDCFHALPKTRNIKKAVSKVLEIDGSEISVDEFFGMAITKLEAVDHNELLKSTNSYIPVHLRPKDWRDTIKSLILYLELAKK